MPYNAPKKFQPFELGQICSRLSSGKGISAEEISDKGTFPVYGGNGLRGYSEKKNFEGQCAIVGRQGAFCGNVRYFSGEAYMTEHAIVVCANEKSDTRYLSYVLGTMALGRLSGQSAQPGLSVKTLSKQIILLPDVNTQRRIASLLALFDEKIALNAQINQNLEAQAEALFAKHFGARQSIVGEKGKAEQFFEINIGKTPPRKEHEWFSDNPTDVTWVSISDMGTCGMYILESSEYLTKEAVERFNIKVVPTDSILLSFKLTVGRVAIADSPLTTNEAIAHFKYSDPAIREFLYFYLKKYDYQTLGSTSSIAIAVNSKMIKSLPFTMPDADTLKGFHRTCAPLFDAIRLAQHETIRLAALRDTLLPKLMSGEIDVSEIEV